MRLLLDTAVFVFAMQTPERLSKRVEALLKDPDNLRELSAVSLTEIAVKATLRKLNISAAMARQALEDLDVRVLTFTAEHAFQLFELSFHHKDPFDRQIIAQAMSEKIAVVTPDEKFGLYKGLKVIW
jgi:PIN domain nuclease of toxin-antitoxin system